MLLFLSLLATAAGPPPGGWPLPPAQSAVASVYDGDTVTLTTGDKIRLRWVNTPELKPPEAYGIEAREAAERFLSGKEATLVLGGENPRDGYGRIVAGLDTDEGSLSLHLLELGLGHVFIIPPDDTDLSEMIAAQDRARAAGRGIWSTDRYQGTLHMTSFHANAAGDDNENVNGEYLRVANVSDGDLNVDGYRIRNARGQEYIFPALVIPNGHTVEVHSGHGQHQTNPAQQLEIFLGSSVPIWDNNRDRAVIVDRFGAVVDARDHERKTPERR